jgi:hypothetical protein
VTTGILDPIFLSRLQFDFVVSFHIIFPAFTIGLAAWLATIEGVRLVTGDCGSRKCDLVDTLGVKPQPFLHPRFYASVRSGSEPNLIYSIMAGKSRPRWHRPA